MNRFSTSPWFPLAVAAVAVMIAGLLTASTLMSILIAAAAGLLAAAIAATLGRADTSHNRGTTNPAQRG